MFLLLLACLQADVAPSDQVARGEIHHWKGPTGAYEYVIPRSYSPKKGATLTLMLHGSNLTREWAFANFKPGEFRREDILVSPDGTTSNGKGGFNFLGEEEDARKVAELVRDLKKRLTINRVYVYGHSQGAYFAYYLMGEYPDLVDGICAHAGGVWSWCRFPAAAKNIAVGILHSKDDPVVPFSLSEGAEELYREKKYANVFFRKTDDWEHMPNPAATQEVLDWCDRVTIRTAEECVGAAERALERADYASARDLADNVLSGRVSGTKTGHKDMAKKIIERLEEIADAHTEAILETLRGDGKKVPSKPGYGAWVEHYRRTADAFARSKALKDLQKAMRSVLGRHTSGAKGSYRTFRAASDAKQYAAAFRAGRRLLETAYLSEHSGEVGSQMEEWLKEFGDRLPEAEVEAYRRLMEERKTADEEGKQVWEEAEP